MTGSKEGVSSRDGSRGAARCGRRWTPLLPGLCVVVVASTGGCPQPIPPIRLEPTKVPPTFVAVAPGQTQQSARFLTGSTLYLKVKDARTGLRVPRATIGIHGPTLAGGVSGATFDLSFGPLTAGTYRLRVSAPGYVTKLQDLAIAARTKSGQKTEDTKVEVVMEPGAGEIVGRVVDAASGAALPGARIQAGDELAFAGADGAFRLAGLAPGSIHSVAIRKTGYAAATVEGGRPGGDLGTVRLAARPLTINLANAGAVFGTTAAAAVLGGLKAALAERATVKEEDPQGADIQVFAAPGEAVAAKASDLLEWARQGGKLVVLGEWGGLAGYSPEAAEALVHSAGIAINADLVRSSQNASSLDWPLASAMAPWPFASADVALFQSASVFAVAPAQAVLRAQGGYRVAGISTQEPAVAAVAPYGAGLVAAAGDTSAWSDANTTGAGPDLGIRDNRSYVVNLILW
ncbi:MAG: carboxypeptidase regulatory-like domain-containing protein [Candidatus Sericytochromatia bacterium]|nr:carboxypeptidase regulatory-like domain-containing protein [Candidatus Tanganyikabacteria bacterium]